MKYYKLILQIHQKKNSDNVNLHAQDLNMFTDLLIKYKGKYSVLDKRINLIKEEIQNKIIILIFLFLLNTIHM